MRNYKSLKSLMALALSLVLINPVFANEYTKNNKFGAKKPLESSGRLTVVAREMFVEPLKDILFEYYEKHPENLLTLKTGADEFITDLIAGQKDYDVFIGIPQSQAFDFQQEKFVRKTYLFAVEQLALYAPYEKIQDIEILKLQTGKISILDPATHDIGKASMQALQAYELDKELKDRIIFAKTLDEQYRNITSKKAEAGFFPYSFLHKKKLVDTKETWIVPNSVHQNVAYSVMINTKADPDAEKLVEDLIGLASKQATSKYGFADISSLDPKPRPKKIKIEDYYPSANSNKGDNIISVPIHK